MFKLILYQLFLSLVFIICSHSNDLNITSESLKVDRKNKVSIFTGNVYAFNPDIEIWSEKLNVHFHENENENEIKEITAEDNVKIINQGITATGEIGTYNPNTEILNIYGNVEVLDNDNYVKCDELFLDIKNSTSIMKSNSSKRVEALIINN